MPRNIEELFERYMIEEHDNENEETIGGNIMDIGEKAKMINFVKDLRHLACDMGNRELKQKLKEEFRCQDIESKLAKEYKFFKGLRKQSDIDNVISLSKIVSRLGVETPKVKLDFNNIEKTYDEIWNDINEQIPVSEEKMEWAKEIAQDILYNIEDYSLYSRLELERLCMELLNEDYAQYFNLPFKEYVITVPIGMTTEGEQLYGRRFIMLDNI